MKRKAPSSGYFRCFPCRTTTWPETNRSSSLPFCFPLGFEYPKSKASKPNLCPSPPWVSTRVMPSFMLNLIMIKTSTPVSNAITMPSVKPSELWDASSFTYPMSSATWKTKKTPSAIRLVTSSPPYLKNNSTISTAIWRNSAVSSFPKKSSSTT